MALDLGKYIAQVRKQDPKQALMLEQIQDAVNQVGQVAGVDPTQHLSPPDPPAALNVKAAGGIAHVTINDPSPRSRTLHYFVEAATEPNFLQPHVEHLGVSRGRFISLPAKDDHGAAQSWYFKAYSMEPGSQQASPHLIFGGSANPTPVSVGGTAALTPLPSTGAGTASTTGQEGGQGFGTAQFSKASNIP